MFRKGAALVAAVALSGTLTWSLQSVVDNRDLSVTAGTRVTGVQGTTVVSTDTGRDNAAPDPTDW
jgi:hypothetical protein